MTYARDGTRARECESFREATERHSAEDVNDVLVWGIPFFHLLLLELCAVLCKAADSPNDPSPCAGNEASVDSLSYFDPLQQARCSRSC
eukprot:6183083-Pleurochrysis_carterae.AAC.1